MVLKSYLWLIPFIFFLAGYFSLSIIYRPRKLEAPSLIGKPLQEAVAITSTSNLNLRLLEQQEDTELPEGTILSQNPSAHTILKPNQTLFCTVSKRPIITAPNLVSKNREAAIHKLKNLGIHARCYALESNYPKEYCFAQSPHSQTQLDIKSIIIYFSLELLRPVLFPDLKNKSVCDIIEFLKPYNIAPSIIHSPTYDQHKCHQSCVIINQRPLPGSLVILNPEKPLPVQLQVAHSTTT